MLSDYPHVEIVVSSAWRQDYTLKNIRTFFLTDLQRRIVGTTPVHEVVDDLEPESRYREILAYIGDRGTAWLALDDTARLFPPDCANLILCANGFKHVEELALRAALDRLLLC